MLLSMLLSTLLPTGCCCIPGVDVNVDVYGCWWVYIPRPAGTPQEGGERQFPLRCGGHDRGQESRGKEEPVQQCLYQIKHLQLNEWSKDEKGMKRPTREHGECVYLLSVSFPYLCAWQVEAVSGESKEDPSVPTIQRDHTERRHTYVRIAFTLYSIYCTQQGIIKYRSHFCFVGRTVQGVLPNVVVITHNDLSEECRDLHTM